MGVRDSIAHALKSTVHGGLTGKRKQTILTPTLILDPIKSVWGGVSMDPCAPPGQSNVCAEVEVRLPDDGLSKTWPDNTFCNPPYAKLKPWLLHDKIDEGARVAWLVPVRPNRRWWRQWARERVDAVIYLNPFAFHGYESSFPVAVCLGYRGHDCQAMVDAFSDLGDPL